VTACTIRLMSTEQTNLAGVAEVPVSDARKHLARLVTKVTDTDQFIYLTNRGVRVAVLMPADIGENYERIEDEYWGRRAEEATASLESGEAELIPFAQLVAETESRSR
jgi:prevent-host-death family protein